MNSLLLEYQKLINNVDKRIEAFTMDEYFKKYPEHTEGWSREEHLIILDSDECKTDVDCILSGAYALDIINNEASTIWLPYPSEPEIGIDNFIKSLTKQVQEHDIKE